MSQINYENLIQLLKLIGGKFIIVEEGQPKAVLMSYNEFQDLAVPKYAGELVEKLKEIEKVNSEITTAQLLDLREEVIVENPEEIKIEPLP